MTRSSRGGVRAAILAVMLALFALVPAAAQEVHVAGLVVDYGDGRMSYAVVPFTEDEINGLDLLQRSGLDIVTVGFGGLGDAVCQVGDTGCSVDECRTRMCQTSDPESPFWQFSKLDGGVWRFVATGASGVAVRDGDIYGWTWTGTPPELPVLAMPQLVERAGGDPDVAVPADVLLRTEGGTPASSEDGNWLSREPWAVAGLGAVVIVAGALVLRSRRVAASDVDER